MSGPRLFTLGATATAAPTKTLAAAAKVVDTRVDVSTQVVIPTIVRGGQEVPAPTLDPKLVEDVIARYQPITRMAVPRAVSQSVPPGTHVAKGTPVDLVFVAVSDIDMSVFTGVHADFKAKNVAEVLPIVEDPVVLPILQRASFAQLTDADKTALTAKLTASNIAVVETDPARTLEAAFGTLQSARAFQ